MEPRYEELRFNLLQEPLIRWRDNASGALHQSSLPELMAAMAVDRVRDFPALRPHQRHVWHAFLVQLAAIALHHVGHDEVWSDAADWRRALLALTPDDADGAAWCLVAPVERPALLQPPVPGERPDAWKNDLHTPDRLDMLVTSKGHDLKAERMRRAQPEDWLFALVSLQTQEGFLGAGNYGISRMNGGFASRLGIGVAAIGAWGQRWAADVARLRVQRAAIARDHGLRAHNGHALLWLLPWSGTESLAMDMLDPLYIEICRRVRLAACADRITARTTGSKTARVAAKAFNGVTGDAWTPVDTAKAKALTVGPAGFDYKLMSELISGQSYTQGAAWRLDGWPRDAKLQVIAQAAARGQGKTDGYHEKLIPISPKMRRLLAGRDDERAVVADAVKKRIDAIAALRKLLWHALALLFANGEQDSINDPIKERASRFARPFEQREDSRFFVDLTAEIEADEADRSGLYLQWQDGLAQRAEVVLRRAFDAGPRSGVQRYKARSAALARLHAGLRGAKPILPDLAHYYQQQQRAAAAAEELPS